MIVINPQNPQQRLIERAVEALRHGAIICYPTDTMYGLGCDIHNQKAVKRIFQIKKRPKHKPFSFMCSSLKNVSIYGHVSNQAYRLMKKALPGPYTFVLPAMKIVPNIMITNQKTVGIRVPANTICQSLVESLGNPILNTSAILEDDDPSGAAEAYLVEERMGRLVDLIIDGGPVYPPVPSTIISLLAEEPMILREGKGNVNFI